jgi:hypothetical protein
VYRASLVPTVHLERARETGPIVIPPPTALYAAHDRKLIGMLTGVGGGGRQGGAGAGFLTKNHQKVSQNVSQNSSQNVSQNVIF